MALGPHGVVSALRRLPARLCAGPFVGKRPAEHMGRRFWGWGQRHPFRSQEHFYSLPGTAAGWRAGCASWPEPSGATLPCGPDREAPWPQPCPQQGCQRPLPRGPLTCTGGPVPLTLGFRAALKPTTSHTGHLPGPCMRGSGRECSHQVGLSQPRLRSLAWALGSGNKTMGPAGCPLCRSARSSGGLDLAFPEAHSLWGREHGDGCGHLPQ